MAVFFWNLVRSDLFSVYYSTIVYTGQVTFYKVSETAMYSWSPCIYLDVMGEECFVVLHDLPGKDEAEVLQGRVPEFY